MPLYTYLSKEGYDKIKNELDHLKTTGRSDAAKAIAEAREKGDLSENAEYDAAKEAQGMLELRINELEKSLSNARILDPNDIDTSKVNVFTKVTIYDTKLKREMTYKIVAEEEANFKEKKISLTSPIGAALLGKRVDEIVQAVTPAGIKEYKILNITL